MEKIDIRDIPFTNDTGDFSFDDLLDEVWLEDYDEDKSYKLDKE